MANGRPSAVPAQLALVQSFLNTLDLETGRDDLVDTSSAQSWLAARRLVSPGTEYDETDRRRLMDVRRALHGLVAANGGGGIHRRAVTTLNESARRVRLGGRLHPEDGYRLMAEGVGIDRPIGELLSSNNRSGRWCSMAKCGNRMKGRAYRHRRGGEAAQSVGIGRHRERVEAAS